MKNLSFVKMEISTFAGIGTLKVESKNKFWWDENRNKIDSSNKSIWEGFICTHFVGQFAYLNAKYIRNTFALNTKLRQCIVSTNITLNGKIKLN